MKRNGKIMVERWIHYSLEIDGKRNVKKDEGFRHLYTLRKKEKYLVKVREWWIQ